MIPDNRFDRHASVENSRHRLPSPHGGSRGELGVGKVDVPLREALQDLFDGNAALEARQPAAETVMGPDTERQMLVRFAPDIENVAVWRELAVIAVRRPDEHHHDALRGGAV